MKHLHRQRDTLFPGGPGKTWSPETFTSLMDDLEERVFGELPDDMGEARPGCLLRH